MGDRGIELPASALGAAVESDGVRFTVWSGAAHEISVCLFDEGDQEIGRLALERGNDDLHSGFWSGIAPGARYGLRADGLYDPEQGLWFDPAKLLVDPYAVEIDRPFKYDSRLAARRDEGVDTAPLMPKAIVSSPLPEIPHQPARWHDGGLIYELSVRAFTKLHPDIPVEKRGTIAALAEPAIIEHLKKIGVTAIELMPVTAWIGERHLPSLGLANAWGYNPVVYSALDPRLAPGGIAELADTVAALHAANIGVFLDVVFNHTGESDELGPTLSLRGLDGGAYFRHVEEGGRQKLVNDTGTGNTLNCAHPATQRLIRDSMRHFVRRAGVDGFRFDLAPILGRNETGFDPRAELLSKMINDPLLGDRILIAEPWDIAAGGYQLGNFPPPFLEWNDKSRDDVRRFWRGDRGGVGALATRLAGSSDIFSGSGSTTRSVNFIAAHDGMTLADLVAYERKHNEANGENNRDGHNENLSWNCGVEGKSDDAGIIAARQRDVKALLATLFASRGAIMLTAGDEFGRTQMGNNNAYAQDNELTWIDWQGRDIAREDFVAELSNLRCRFPALSQTVFFAGGVSSTDDADVRWLTTDGDDMQTEDWEAADNRRLCMLLNESAQSGRLAVLINGADEEAGFRLPDDIEWDVAMSGHGGDIVDNRIIVAGRSVAFRCARVGRPIQTKRQP